MARTDKSPLICYCNAISKATIEKAIQEGSCHTLSEIFDSTHAGVGPCGGSCQPVLRRMLEHYLATGEFLRNPKRAGGGKTNRRRRSG